MKFFMGKESRNKKIDWPIFIPTFLVNQFIKFKNHPSNIKNYTQILNFTLVSSKITEENDWNSTLCN